MMMMMSWAVFLTLLKSGKYATIETVGYKIPFCLIDQHCTVHPHTHLEYAWLDRTCEPSPCSAVLTPQVLV
jgi:hypothetical protein